MSLYTKARKHIDMNRVKELREEAVKEQKIAEVKKQQEEIIAELKRIEIKEDSKYSNWRRDLENLNEDMTTNSLGMVNYAAVGDVNLDTVLLCLILVFQALVVLVDIMQLHRIQPVLINNLILWL